MQNLIGKVVSTKMAKSVVVSVKRQVPHPVYLKRITMSKKYMAHDEDEVCSEGDTVRITACRPMSAKKRFSVSEVLAKAFVSGDMPLPGETGGA